MLIDEQQIKKIAELASLTFNKENLASYSENLSEMLTLFEKLNEVPTCDISEDGATTTTQQFLREDTITLQKNDSNNLQKLASDTQDGFYVVPRVIDL